MSEHIRIYISMIIAFVIVVGYESFVSFLVRRDYQKLIAIYKTSQPTTTIQPTQAYFFKPTITLPSVISTGMPTNIPIPTLTWYPTPIKIPTKAPTRIPTRAPTTVPTKAPAVSQRVSKSKLSIFIIGSYTAGAKRILEENPPLVKIIEPTSDGAFFEALRAYKQRVPDGLAIVRFWEGTAGLKYPLESNPVNAAQDFFNRVVQPGLNRLGSNKNLFDYLQTPNEFETTPEWWGETKIRWNGAFWRKLTELNINAGIKTCIGGIPVGNVQATELGFMIEDLKVMKQLGAAFCYHGYTFDYSKDVNNEIQLSLRYRQFYNYFRDNASELVNMPLILSEGGVAENGDSFAGYQKYGHSAQYESWLEWFDSELRKDNYVKGVTLFQIGNNSDWNAFNLEPISNWLADYIRSQQ